jgi:GDPmannose 4,6-dehydratase
MEGTSLKEQKKVALIFGASGQDGAYLAYLLLWKGYEVHGVSRDAEVSSFANLTRLGIRQKVRLHSGTLTDFRSTLSLLIAIQPHEIYNVAGQTSIALSFNQPVETFDSITQATLNVLECIRFSKLPVRFFNAVSSDCFGNSETPADEDTPFRPRSPYGMAKAAAFWATQTYREAYNMHVCSGILSNHESPLRPERFVCRKIVSTAVRIAQGSKEKLILGNVSILRDWGLAAEYVGAIWRILQQDQPEDFVIATGETHSLREFIDAVFACVGLDTDRHLEIDPSLFRPLDLPKSYLNPQKAAVKLNWTAKTKMRNLARLLVECEKDGSVGDLPTD